MKSVQCLFHDNGNGRIFYTLIGGSLKSNKCTIVFYPLFEERMWSQRVIFDMCQKFLENGMPVLLFDYYGYGESDGDTEDFTIMRCKEDVGSLLSMLENQFDYKEFIFLGVRTGCYVQLSCFFDLQHKISSMLFWAPVLDLDNFIYKSLRSTVASQTWVFKKIVAKRDEIIAELLDTGECNRGEYLLNHIDGYRIGKKFYLEIKNINYQKELLDIACCTYVLEILPLKKIESLPKKKKIQQHLYEKSKKITYEIIACQEFWLNSLDYSQSADDINQLTLRWLKKNREIL